jgi:hypothetical protein
MSQTYIIMGVVAVIIIAIALYFILRKSKDNKNSFNKSDNPWIPVTKSDKTQTCMQYNEAIKKGGNPNITFPCSPDNCFKSCSECAKKYPTDCSTNPNNTPIVSASDKIDGPASEAGEWTPDQIRQLTNKFSTIISSSAKNANVTQIANISKCVSDYICNNYSTTDYNKQILMSSPDENIMNQLAMCIKNYGPQPDPVNPQPTPDPVNPQPTPDPVNPQPAVRRFLIKNSIIN